jgi:hypothetical protein
MAQDLYCIQNPCNEKAKETYYYEGFGCNVLLIKSQATHTLTKRLSDSAHQWVVYALVGNHYVDETLKITMRGRKKEGISLRDHCLYAARARTI